MAKKKASKGQFLTSAKDIYRLDMYSPLKGLSKKEKAQEKAVQWSNNFTNAVNMMFNSLEAEKTRSFNAEEAEKARQFNASEALKSRQWQTEQSNTAHQRETQDLIKAGLNPHLSANTGAQSYTTNAASIGSGASASNASVNLSSAAQAMASYGGAYQSALASRYAADRHLQAAEAQASAQRYAADQARAAQQYVADKNFASSWPGFLYKAMDGIADWHQGKKTDNAFNKFMYVIEDSWKDVQKTNPSMASDLSKKLKSGDITYNQLQSSEQNLMELAVTKLGINADPQALNALVKAASGNKEAAEDLFYYWLKVQQRKGKYKNIDSKGETRYRRRR